MKSSARLLSAVVAGTFVFAVGSPVAHALSEKERKCQENIAKSGRRFFKKKLKAVRECNDKLLKDTLDPCACELPGIIAALEGMLDTNLDKKCAELNEFNFESMGFPGKCSDPDPSNGFTTTDLKLCMRDGHEATVNDLIEIEYGTIAGPITNTALLECQKKIAQQGGKYADWRLKNLQKCRDYLTKGKLSGFLPKNCATDDPKTKEKIDKAESKARVRIIDMCTGEADELVPQLDVCDPPAATAVEAADCIIQTHADAVDYLIEIEYPGDQTALCGDNNVNAPDEECDGGDDAACVGQCGAPGGNFSCLCLNKKRERYIEHANADLDNGWTGQAHDQGIVEGGGYTLDLYDCDGPGGPDVECIVGPNCNIWKARCGNNTDCPTPGDFCRKERTAVGPHCYFDQMVACTSNAQCPGIGNFCLKQYNGLPLPLAAGAISVCVVNEFSEDIVGTTNLATGESAVSLRQDSITHLEGNIPQPCPVCGNWCNDPVRRNCTTNADCDPGVTCVTEPLCSRGPNKDHECRPDPPFGGVSPLFGITSVDCPPNPPNKIATIDVHFNPATTGTVTWVPTYPCSHPGFQFKTCRGGANNGVKCTTDTQCPGGVCSEQCFCPSVGGTPQAPNQCEAACVGGGNDGNFCIYDSECPSGFCHAGDCRDSGVNDEGVCTAGPIDQKCSLYVFRGCTSNFDCRKSTDPKVCVGGSNNGGTCTDSSECPGGSCLAGPCPYCSTGETCVAKMRECYVNSVVVRHGVAHPTDPVSVALFCLTATSNSATNSTAGLPGLGSLVEPGTRVFTGFF